MTVAPLPEGFPIEPTFDSYGRRINYLRISLTDACNLRCVYCMPEDMHFRPRNELMSDEELLHLVKIAASLGVTKIRLTGGEPTIRPGIVDLVRAIAATPGIKDLAMTTNGILLDKLARPLAEAGLKRVNISIDTLDAEKFHRITRWGHLDDVWRGIRAAEENGLLPIKLHSVVVRNFNDGQDMIDLAQLTVETDWEVRFIEMMPFGEVANFAQDAVVSQAEIIQRIEAQLGPLTPVDDGKLDGEARLYRLAGSLAAVGFISTVTNPFCASCTRSRLTADGKLRLCLLRDDEGDLLTPLRNGASDAEMEQLIRSLIWRKPWGHGLPDGVIPLQRVMSQIGG